MNNTGVDIAISTLNKLTAQELAAASAICASNGIGPGRCTFPRHRLQHCVVCGRWWKASAVSTHLTIWTGMPDWVIRMLWHNIWESAENHPTQERGNHE